MNIARKDETEQPQIQAGRPAPPCQVWAPGFWRLLLILSFHGYFGVLVQKMEERIEGKRKERSNLRYGMF
jgi:hypothetical protein